MSANTNLVDGGYAPPNPAPLAAAGDLGGGRNLAFGKQNRKIQIS